VRNHRKPAGRRERALLALTDREYGAGRLLGSGNSICANGRRRIPTPTEWKKMSAKVRMSAAEAHAASSTGRMVF
jgi:hypothetical protein